MTKVIGDPMRSDRAALAVTVMLGLLALAAALMSQGCASKGRVAEVQPTVREAPPAEVSAAAPAASAPSAPPQAKKSPEPSPSKQAATAALDLKSLEKRLRETKAIGVFTKLSLKNQVDDLLDHFRAFHQGKGGTKLAELRQSYVLLMMKVLSLLQDSDPPLARDIVTSREGIWSLLADPAKFATLS